MEGRGLSGFYTNTSEELFLKTLMENSVAMPAPTMEMLGFKNLSQNFRTDSEELFKSWLTNAENNGYNSPGVAHRRQLSKRISSELGNLSNQQHGDVLQSQKGDDVTTAENSSAVNDISSDLCQDSVSRNAVERGWQASNLHLAKAWFHSSQPMTRSRSSELRRRYAAMQNAQTMIGMEAMQNATGQGLKMKQEFASPNCFTDHSMNDVPEQLGTFVSPSNSSSSTFSAQPVNNLDKVSSVVSMLKGTLERKRLANRAEKEAFEDCSQGFFQAQGVVANTNFYQGQGNMIHETFSVCGDVFSSQVKEAGVPQTVDGSIDLDLDGFMNSSNPIQQGRVSQEPSQSESSAAAPVVSPSLDLCDGPGNSIQTLSVAESSRKHVGGSMSAENGSRVKDFRERIIDNLKDDRKSRNLERYGSVTSVGSSEKGDPTKKRRVERSRKMAEAKERNSTSTIPSDTQAVLKRCENLEKEVRSLKLNLSFMNRKDSEQTKQIEELQKQNDELTEEKERLLEEIERILGDSGHR
ncbi:protein CYCLOPS-like isoform X1 [Punica granatum]|uniref:Protein CYCLOPS-like isoform X1 n=1 Tax=Punica granatum TaxID=22663 RepID=A0A6P8BVM2_PUNGR|nr:protein CYCLOPS-like isoform X1 [Punica granatum]